METTMILGLGVIAVAIGVACYVIWTVHRALREDLPNKAGPTDISKPGIPHWEASQGAQQARHRADSALSEGGSDGGS